VFFSGFALCGEESLFKDYYDDGDSVCGFSYGAQKAFLYAKNNSFVKRLILLSPAFYAQKTEEFKEAQMAAYTQNPALYRLKLLKKSGLNPDEIDSFKSDSTIEELRELLYFEWSEEDVKSMLERGVQIDVYIGGEDGVVEPEPSFGFFGRSGAKTVWLENKNHILR
jgi:dienelactone hydrolase